jgi:hypothetical protein
MDLWNSRSMAFATPRSKTAVIQGRPVYVQPPKSGLIIFHAPAGAYARHGDPLVAEGKGTFERIDTFFQDVKISVDTEVPDPYYCIVGRG